MGTRYAGLRTLVAFWALPCLIAFANLATKRSPRVAASLLISAGISALGFIATKRLIPLLAKRMEARGLFGLDINKKGTQAGEKRIPEALGLAVGVVFLVCVICFQQLHYYDASGFLAFASRGMKGDMEREVIADAWLVDYNAALATICFMLFLGFADDVLDIPWRVKLALPLLASLPLLVAYSGGTSVVIPRPLRDAFGAPEFLELGFAYKVYMMLLACFCANSINILAGVNGLEAGQTLVLGFAFLLHNLMELAKAEEGPVEEGHLFSAYLMLPLVSTTLALLSFNWYPSQVFVGDTFTYFAGMALGVAGILGHFSETLLLFFAPQVFNFLYSTPQLFKLVPCPRHRLPRLDPATGFLHATPNYNLVNLMLTLTGPCTERTLCMRLLMLQSASCAAAFGVRHLLTGHWK
uniref:UDP-N-acetylglucosamine--dolichyl-phosphate N-acetylglucosaminephosphotransferase n=1 Tax=Tetraselmis sp. GSL018 TaxID=582737 RepID=A0A061R2T3_9CHLO|mmetsp:Transcript_6929/g.16697  ORF Transcript_6929/g.16697 Transcript_6929/m.16697 type:complete len:411 (+) Transcript_6929:187-1419(+)